MKRRTSIEEDSVDLNVLQRVIVRNRYSDLDYAVIRYESDGNHGLDFKKGEDEYFDVAVSSGSVTIKRGGDKVKQLDLNGDHIKNSADDLNFPNASENSDNTIVYVAGGHSSDTLVDFDSGAINKDSRDSDGVDKGGHGPEAYIKCYTENDKKDLVIEYNTLP